MEEPFSGAGIYVEPQMLWRYPKNSWSCSLAIAIPAANRRDANRK